LGIEQGGEEQNNSREFPPHIELSTDLLEKQIGKEVLICSPKVRDPDECGSPAVAPRFTVFEACNTLSMHW
jgi:hypothetical protein